VSEFVAIARSADLGEGAILATEVAGRPVVLTRVEGVVYVLDNECSHDQSPFDAATLEGYELCCPRHAGRFDVRTGKATRFPAVWPVRTWEAKEENDWIWVRPPEGER
jgi:3-phenylpropionate/trans-cinnamate dioxygenase ferredoxin subunit